MTEEITNKIGFDVLGNILLLAFSSGVLQTALLMNYFSRLTNRHYMKLTYLYTITVNPQFHTYISMIPCH
jgi:hypothetical protein